MRKTIYIGLMLCLAAGVQAEIVVLLSGTRMEGEIVMQNEDIVMLRDKEGRKFQFPRGEVVEIKLPETLDTSNLTNEEINMSKGNCALRLDLSGGGVFVPSLKDGAYGAVDLQIGTRKIGHQRVFLGGSVGYQAAISDKTYHFLPIMMVFSMPLISGQHAPEIGASLGYGFAIKQPSQGGIVAKLDLSWRYQYAATSALLVGVQTRFQQAQVKSVENITEQDKEGNVIYNQNFTSTLGKNFVSLGLRLALEF